MIGDSRKYMQYIWYYMQYIWYYSTAWASEIKNELFMWSTMRKIGFSKIHAWHLLTKHMEKIPHSARPHTFQDSILCHSTWNGAVPKNFLKFLRRMPHLGASQLAVMLHSQRDCSCIPLQLLFRHKSKQCIVNAQKNNFSPGFLYSFFEQHVFHLSWKHFSK